ncbi:MAG: hypothetical protein MR695_08840 [Solobacterium sp.]|nr:hypothetical protein [Solobacterium sp.]
MTKPKKLYKGKYFIVFYDKNDERLLYTFDNVKEILKFQKKEINTYNARLLNIELYRALKSDEHFITFLTGEVMRVYIITDKEEETHEE